MLILKIVFPISAHPKWAFNSNNIHRRHLMFIKINIKIKKGNSKNGVSSGQYFSLFKVNAEV